jgi:hypothetical protein
MLLRLLHFLLPPKCQIAEYYICDGYFCRIFIDYTPSTFEFEPYIWEVYRNGNFVDSGRGGTEDEAFTLAEDFITFLVD